MRGMEIQNNILNLKDLCDNVLMMALNSLETPDLIHLSSTSKVFRVREAIWKEIARKYHQKIDKKSELKEKMIAYLKTPIVLNVYHLLSGIQKRSLTKNRYIVYPSIKLESIQKYLTAKAVSQRINKDEEHCEICLQPGNKIPFYSVYKNEECSLIAVEPNTEPDRDECKEIVEGNRNKFYLISPNHETNFIDISKFLSIYEALTGEPGVTIPKEIGPIGLFSIDESNQWRLLHLIKFFKKNQPLHTEMEFGLLKTRSILVITDISYTAEDRNTIKPTEAEDGYYCPYF